MKIYYHHVGEPGANADFPKTVFNNVPIQLVKDSLPDIFPFKSLLIQDLEASFPDGVFNCWGVPSGAAIVIKNLKIGDAVLLVESVNIKGEIPALAIVKVYHTQEMTSLSQALWGNTKYSYIFFFKTIKLDYYWINLLDEIGYNENFDPRGKFYAIADSRLEKFGGAEAFLEHLIRNYSHTSFTYPEEIPQDVSFLEGGVTEITVNSYERNQYARRKCIDILGNKCIICGFDFYKEYGEIGLDYIHVHHLINLAKIGKEYIVNPEKDLIPVCPNCHAMLHKRSPSFSVDEMKEIVNSKKLLIY